MGVRAGCVVLAAVACLCILALQPCCQHCLDFVLVIAIAAGAVVGGVVGGVGGALVAAAVVAFIVIRRRRATASAASHNTSLRHTFNPAFAAGGNARLTVRIGSGLKKDLEAAQQRDEAGVVVRTATPDTTRARAASTAFQ